MIRTNTIERNSIKEEISIGVDFETKISKPSQIKKFDNNNKLINIYKSNQFKFSVEQKLYCLF